MRRTPLCRPPCGVPDVLVAPRGRCGDRRPVGWQGQRCDDAHRADPEIAAGTATPPCFSSLGGEWEGGAALAENL